MDDLEAGLIRSPAFGGVHRFVCLLDAIFPVEIAGLKRDDSETERERRVIAFDEVSQRGSQAFGDECRVLATDLGQDHQELVASEPTDAIVRARVLSQRDADLPQRRVARVMATSIVDRLETVAVEQG